jgi:hypothetical protein
MKILLLEDFCDFHLGSCPAAVEVSDLIYTGRNIEFIDTKGGGKAKYLNSGSYEIFKIEYEWFIDSLPHAFRRGRSKCDLIVYTNHNSYFFLNELTKSVSASKKRKHAKKQLKQSLSDLMSVPTIKNFINLFNIKCCIFFNSHIPTPDPTIIATTAFNPVVFKSPSQIKNLDIENFGFTLWSCPEGISYELN